MFNIADWKEIPGQIATNPDLQNGGIIDQEIVSKKWFCIFNDDEIQMVEDIPTREEAFRVFEQKLYERKERLGY